MSVEAPEALYKHTDEFKKQVITVLPGIHCAIGYGLANSILVEGIDGNIIIDVLESREAALKAQEDFQKISSKPVVAIIYTHHHGDHVFGADVFAGKNQEQVKVYAHSTTQKLLETVFNQSQPIGIQRSMRQFGILLNKDTGHLNSGIGPFLDYKTVGVLHPTDTFDGTHYNVNIAGRDFVLYHAPGETDDQIVIHMPKESVLFAADNIYKAFPNIYAIRGTATRDPVKWAASLDLMRNLKAKYLIPSHTKPIVGEQQIFDTITNYRDAIVFVHEQTVSLMNEGLTPDEIIGRKLIQLPVHLKDHPFLQEFYGTVDWGVRAIFHQYLGWFSGKSSDLNPDAPLTRAQNLIELAGGTEQVFQQATKAFAEEKYQWSLQLTEALSLVLGDDTTAEILRLRIASLQKLASKQMSANGRNWYLTEALELQTSNEKLLSSTTTTTRSNL